MNHVTLCHNMEQCKCLSFFAHDNGIYLRSQILLYLSMSQCDHHFSGLVLLTCVLADSVPGCTCLQPPWGSMTPTRPPTPPGRSQRAVWRGRTVGRGSVGQAAGPSSPGLLVRPTSGTTIPCLRCCSCSCSCSCSCW